MANCVKVAGNKLNPIRPKRGQYCPLTYDRLSIINNTSQWPKSFWLFLNMYILWLQTKNVMRSLTGVLRWVSNRPGKICSAYFVHIYIFSSEFYLYYHFRCLNILNFYHWLHFWCKKKNWSILTAVLFWSNILAMILPFILYLA